MKKIMSLRRIVIFFPALLIFISCDDVTTVTINKDLVVVQAFIFADQPVKNIALTEVLPLGSEDTLAPPITDAEVALIKGDNRFILIPDIENPGKYLYPEDDLKIISGDYLELEIKVKEQRLFAETTVPPKPENIKLNSDTLLIPEFIVGAGRQAIPDIENYSINLTWDNSDESYYYVVVESIEENPEPIDVAFGRFASRFISEPSISAEYRISFRTVTHLGKHLVILYRVNQEYVDLYESRDQDSRNLNEPLTNIQNGLGVFSAFASDSLYFYVVKE